MEVYGYNVEVADIHPNALTRIVERQLRHILGNEVAASVGGRIKRAIVGDGGDIDTVSVDAMSTWRESNAAQVTSWEKELRDAKLQAIKDGTLSVRAERAPSRDPIEVAARAIAKMEIVPILAKQNVKFPTGKNDDGTPKTILAADGVTQLSGDDLIDRRLANPKHADRIMAAAKRKVDADRRLKEQAAKAAVESDDEL